MKFENPKSKIVNGVKRDVGVTRIAIRQIPKSKIKVFITLFESIMKKTGLDVKKASSLMKLSNNCYYDMKGGALCHQQASKILKKFNELKGE